MLIPANFKKSEIKALVFDLGNVIADLDVPHLIGQIRSLGVIDEVFGANPQRILEEHDAFYQDIERGVYKRESFLKALRSRTSDGVPAVSDGALIDAWNSVLHKPLDPRRIELLHNLRADGYRLFLLSNTNDIHREFFTRKFFDELGIELETLFDKTFYSDVLRCRKPERAIYEHVAREARLVPAETLFIDDKEENCRAARQFAGWHTHTLAVGTETVRDLFVEA
ncbi:MAG: HAD family phosphatase [Opitutales bacterium]|nr:HAD family phosphatase [Opitutales bacterium]